MSNKLRGEVSVEIEGKTYTLSSSFTAIMHAEEVAGVGIPSIALKGMRGQFGMKDAAAVLYGGLVGSGVTKYSFVQLGTLICTTGKMDSPLWRAATELAGQMVSDEEVQTERKKPEASQSTST